MKTKYKFLFGLKIVAGITLFVIGFGFGTMYLWNWLVPMLFHGPIITFWQAIGLLVLSKILFSGKGGWGRHRHCGGGGRHNYWKYRMKERWGNMSEEEKEALKERFKNKCRGYWDEKWMEE